MYSVVTAIADKRKCNRSGVAKLVVVVNKMDDPSVLWSKERFDEVHTLNPKP